MDQTKWLSKLRSFDISGKFPQGRGFIGDMVAESQGAFYVVGTFDGDASMGMSDGFVIKYDSEGAELWRQIYATRKNDSVTDAKLAEDGSLYVSGWTQGDLDGITNSRNDTRYISKISSAGEKIWTIDVDVPVPGGGSNNFLQLDVQNSIYALGQVGDSPVIKKYDSQGNLIWTSDPLSDGEFLLGAYQVKDFRIDSSGSFFILYSRGDDINVMKLSKEGTPQWRVMYGTSKNDDPTSIEVDDAGNVYVAGATEGSLNGREYKDFSDPFLMKVSGTDGSEIWTRVFGTYGGDAASDLKFDGDGTVYVQSSFGYSSEEEQYAEGTYLISFDLNGGVNWNYFLSFPYTYALTSLETNQSLGSDRLYVAFHSSVGLYQLSTASEAPEILRAEEGRVTLVTEDWWPNARFSKNADGSWAYAISGGPSMRLEGYKRVLFEDGVAVALDIDGVGGQAYRVYKASFNREPDTNGLGYWIAQMDLGMDLLEVSARFIDSEEFRLLYGDNPTDEFLLTKVYQNVLGRDPEPEGYNWWLNEIRTNPEKTRAKILADFSESSENKQGVLSLVEGGISYRSIPTVKIIPESNSINEGERAIFHISSVNIPAGTANSFSINMERLDDVVSGSGSGSFLLDDRGQATLSFNVVADDLREGTEELTLGIFATLGFGWSFSIYGNATIQILDTTPAVIIGTPTDPSDPGDGGGGGGGG